MNPERFFLAYFNFDGNLIVKLGFFIKTILIIKERILQIEFLNCIKGGRGISSN